MRVIKVKKYLEVGIGRDRGDPDLYLEIYFQDGMGLTIFKTDPDHPEPDQNRDGTGRDWIQSPLFFPCYFGCAVGAVPSAKRGGGTGREKRGGQQR